jgi:ATP-binding cassette subfamily F protein 3
VSGSPALAARGLAKSFGGRLVLAGVDLDVPAGARLGVLGPNGGGKSTLMRILVGLEEPDAGEVIRRRGLVDAFLPQLVPGDERDALATVLSARPELAELETALVTVERRIATLTDDLDAMQRALAHQARLLERWEQVGGDRAEREARSHLQALGMEDVHTPTRELSGGQRKLVALAACLAREPDLLLLDEPEAHLDMDRRDQLEAVIDGFGGAVLMVSHDRHLLDECVDQVAELDNGRVRIWNGGYSAYTVARQVELERRQQVYVTQQKEIARLEEAAKRFEHWAHIRVNERAARQARVKRMQIERMDKVDRPVLERRKMGLALRSAVRGGQRVLALEGVDVAFDSDPVLLDATSRSTAASGSASSGRTGPARACCCARSRATSRSRPGNAGLGRASRSATSARPPSCHARPR